jgi:membrane-associated phospholipid phosphatase
VRILCLTLLLTLSVATAEAQDTSPAPAAPTVTELPGRIVHDLRRLGSRTPLLTIAIGGALALAVRPADARVVASMSGNHAAEESLDAGSALGDGFVQVGAAVATYGIGASLHRPAAASFGADLIEAQAVTGLMTQVLKVTVDRTRPNGGGHSFPSGHASATFATAGVIARRFGCRYGSIAYAAAGYVAASRITDRQHYPSDVIFGAALGIAGAHTVDIPARAGRVRLNVQPVPRGMMVAGQFRTRAPGRP